MKKKVYVYILVMMGVIFHAAGVRAQITNPQFIVLSLDDLVGTSTSTIVKYDTGVDFLIELTTGIRAYGLARNPSVTPPKLLMTLACNAGNMEKFAYYNSLDTTQKWKQLWAMGYQFTSHGLTHCSAFPPNMMGDLSMSDLLVEDKGNVDWFRRRLPGCHRWFAFRHGGNTCASTCPNGKWSANCSLLARDIDCFPHGWPGSSITPSSDGPIGITNAIVNKWPFELTVHGFTSWYNAGGYNALYRISLSTVAATATAEIFNSWMNTFNTVYNGVENPRPAVGGFFHDYDVSKTYSTHTKEVAEARREGMRQFLKKVLVDDNQAYVSTGTYKDVYCITYQQYQEYYWLVNNSPEKNYNSIEEILAKGPFMQTCKYSVEPSTVVEAESVTKKSGGSAVSGGWKLASGTDFIGEVVNFPEDNSTYAIDIVAKGTQGSDSVWPIAQVKMSAVINRLSKLSTDEGTYFSEVASVTVNSTGWNTFTMYVSFPVTLSDRKVYARANAVALKLQNAGNGRDLDIDKVTFRRITKLFQQGIDSYTGGDSMYVSNAGAKTTTGEDLRLDTADSKIFLKFDISSIPSSKTVTNATVMIYARGTPNSASAPTFEAHATDNNWAGTPAITGPSLDIKRAFTPGQYMEFDITSLAASAVSGGSGTLIAGIKCSSNTSTTWYIPSSRSTWGNETRPQLRISYPESTDTTPPADIATVRDGTGADESATTLTTQLSANWTASADSESGVAAYWYAIGTTAGATDTVGWTNSGTNLGVTRGSLVLTVGATYYFTVKAQNGYGLYSTNAANSDGQYVASSSTGTGGGGGGGGGNGGLNPPGKAYPNPVSIRANGSTKFGFSGTAGGNVNIYTVSGTLVRRLSAGAGSAFITWQLTNESGQAVRPGVYVYKVSSNGGTTATGKIALTK